MQPWALVTPASRGIGFALTRRILQTTSIPVIATARSNLDQTKETLLKGLKDVDESRLSILPLDVTDESTIESAAAECESRFPQDTHHLHVAFAIPGILYPEKNPSQIDASKALRTFQVNSIGPLLLIKHFHKFLPSKKTDLPDSKTEEESWAGLNQKHATWATMSARVGSISDNSLGGWYSYRSSKAAVNQIVKTFDIQLKTMAGEKAIAVGLHPGTVKTSLSKEFWGSTTREKLFEPDWIAERLVALTCGGAEVQTLGIQERGRCWDWAGKEVLP